MTQPQTGKSKPWPQAGPAVLETKEQTEKLLQERTSGMTCFPRHHLQSFTHMYHERSAGLDAGCWVETM